MKNINFLILVMFLITNMTVAQHDHDHGNSQILHGRVLEQTADSLRPLAFAHIFWLGTQVGATSNKNGFFELPKIHNVNKLIISYIGLKNDTLTIQPDHHFVDVHLSLSELPQVIVRASRIDEVSVNHTETLTTHTFKKAACCTLSESFETNASVDATTTDAVMGTRQIRMLGLDGVYSQLMIEGMPMLRGLNIRSGLHFIPSSWALSVDINKGAGSVIHGYESITGQINTQLVHPSTEKNLLNMYASLSGRLESNLNIAHVLTDKWKGVTLLHASGVLSDNDRNQDKFLDIPKYHIYNVLNRWKYQGDKTEFQIGVRLLDEHKYGGQVGYKPQSSLYQQLYGVENNTQRVEGWLKGGIIFNDRVSWGNQMTTNYHQLKQIWGLRSYDAQEHYFYYNGILDYTISDQNTLRVGVGYVFNRTRQNYQDLQNTDAPKYDLNRRESIPNLFAEYTFNQKDQFTAVLGLRTDFHNLYGTQVSPRVHLKWNMTTNTVLRASLGKGFRVANPIVEHGAYLASGRVLRMAHHLKPEVAWNYGASWVQGFELANRSGKITIDYYRSDFQNQVILDLEQPDEIAFENLDGKSYANAFQVQCEYEALTGLSTTLAYKWYDVRVMINQQLVQIPFTATHRFFLNAGYETKNEKWAFDVTLQWVGKQRLPKSSLDMVTWSPDYFLLNAQITRNFNNVEVYLGSENITNYRQSNPILNRQNPFSTSFDAGRVYAPLIGRLGYVGFRWYF